MKEARQFGTLIGLVLLIVVGFVLDRWEVIDGSV